MPLQFNPESGEILYRGKVVGKLIHSDDADTVEISLSYTIKKEERKEWSVPLTYFAYGLNVIEPDDNMETFITFTTDEDYKEIYPQEHQLLIEITIKRKNSKWRFHKNDSDSWPSDLHGHDNEYGEILDARSGYIYNSITGKKIKKLGDYPRK